MKTTITKFGDVQIIEGYNVYTFHYDADGYGIYAVHFNNEESCEFLSSKRVNTRANKIYRKYKDTLEQLKK